MCIHEQLYIQYVYNFIFNFVILKLYAYMYIMYYINNMNFQIEMNHFNRRYQY